MIGTDGSTPPPGRCLAVPGMTLYTVHGGRAEQQLENQLGRPQPSATDTRAAPLASWSALSRATMG